MTCLWRHSSHPFTTSALDGGEWLVPGSHSFTGMTRYDLRVILGVSQGLC